MSKKGRPPIQRSPTDKKQLSYARDCRNDYGNNDKAARKAIPRNKQDNAQRMRRKANAATGKIIDREDAVADTLESSVRQGAFANQGPYKVADLPLGKWVIQQKEKARARIGDKARRHIKHAQFSTLLDLKT